MLSAIRTVTDWPVLLMKVAGWAVSILIGLVLLVAPGWYLRGCVDSSEATEIQAAWDKDRAVRAEADKQAAITAFQKAERTLQETQNANDQDQAETRRAYAARDVARTDRERLRDTADHLQQRIADLTDADPTNGGDEGGAVARELFGECVREAKSLAGAHGDLGEAATALAGQVRSLQRYARIVSGEPVIRPEGDRGDR